MFRTLLIPLILIAVMAIALSACSSTPASMRSRMQQWASSSDVNYTSAEMTISSDLLGIAAGLRRDDFRGLQTDCDGFYADAGAIYGGLPAPDATVTNELNVAVNQYWLPGALSCEHAQSLRSKDIQVFQRDLQRGNVIYAQAEKIIHGFGIS